MRPVFKIDLYAQDVQDATIPGKERKVRGRIKINGYDNNGNPEQFELSYEGTEHIPDPLPSVVEQYINSGDIQQDKITGIDQIFIVRHYGSPGCIDMIINGQRVRKCF